MGTAVAWILVAALATVASVAGTRLLMALRGRLPAGRGAGALIHLAMALGMALMAVPSGGVLPEAAPRVGFGALGAVLAVGSLVASARSGSAHGRHGLHGLHHATMCGVMVLMTVPARGGTAMAGMAPGMAAHVGADMGAGMAPHMAAGMAPGMGAGMAADMAPHMAAGMAAGMAPGMAAAPSPLLLAAFAYACAVALLFAWRMPGPRADPLGHACEVTMLTSTVVMLLPML